jgi:hypothetical protein
MVNTIKTPFENSLAIAGASLTDIGDPIILEPEFNAGQKSFATRVALEFQNESAAMAVGDFALLGKAHADGAWHILLQTTGWDTVAGILQAKVGTLKALAAASVGLAVVDFGPLYAIKFQTKSGGSTILSNGTFTSNANDWTLGTGIAYDTNNVAFTAATDTAKQALADMSTGWTDTLTYEVTFTISGYSAGSLTVGTNTDADQGGAAIEADGTYTRIVTADAHADGLVFTATGFTGVLDTVSAIETIPASVRGTLFTS